MKWFKHDVDANMNAKLQEVLLDHGLEGYGLYWYCVELVASNVGPDKLTFELEHDARVIARNTGLTVHRVEEMMKRFIDLNLFNSSNGHIMCLKLAKRCDDYTARLVRENGVQPVDNFLPSSTIDMLETQSPPSVLQSPTKSEKVPLEIEIEVEVEVEVEKNKNTSMPAGIPSCPVEKIKDMYSEHCPSLPKVKILSEKRKKVIRSRWKESPKHQGLDFWEWFFKRVESSDFLSGRSGGWNNCGFDWVLKSENFIKIIEGNYINREPRA